MDLSHWKSSQPKCWFKWKPIVIKHPRAEPESKRPHLDEGYIMKKRPVNCTCATSQRDKTRNRMSSAMTMKDLMDATRLIQGNRDENEEKSHRRMRRKVRHHLRTNKFPSLTGKQFCCASICFLFPVHMDALVSYTFSCFQSSKILYTQQ